MLKWGQSSFWVYSQLSKILAPVALPARKDGTQCFCAAADEPPQLEHRWSKFLLLQLHFFHCSYLLFCRKIWSRKCHTDEMKKTLLLHKSVTSLISPPCLLWVIVYWHCEMHRLLRIMLEAFNIEAQSKCLGTCISFSNVCDK